MPPEEDRCIFRKEIFDFVRDKRLFKSSVSNCTSEVLNYVYSKLSVLNINDEEREKCLVYTKSFVSLLFKKWKASKRTLNVFLKSESSWICKQFKMPILLPMVEEETEVSKRGRPEKSFKECGIKAKKRKIQGLMDRSSEELSLATESKLREEGKRTKAEIVKKAINSSPRTLRALKTPTATTSMIPYTPEEALALITELNLTKHQYKNLQKSAKHRNANLYPTYESVLGAKKQCYPPSTSITIEETLCEIELQALLDFTVQHISESQHGLFNHHCKNDESLECTWKWGCDGSGGHSRYKQNFLVNPSASDSDILLTCVVPLEIKKKTATGSTTLWINSRTSSSRYCRPVRFKFVKENTEAIVTELDRMQSEISNLQTTNLTINEKT